MSASMDISATEREIGGILESGLYRLEVPKYQRSYSWGKEQWDMFWNDLTSISRGETHFLGSIVVIERETEIGELDVVSIVDGQQRLTTASILLNEMKVQYQIEGKEGIVEKLDEYLWVSDQDGEEYPKITLGHYDNEEYQSLINGELPSENNSQIGSASEFFSKKLQATEIDQIDKLRKRLLEAMTVVRIECNDDESAFKLFETLNDRGLPLSAVDLMKNYLFKRTSRESSIDYEAVRDAWEETIEEIRSDLNQPRRFFIHYITSAPEPDIRNAITKTTLYSDFKDIVDEIIESEDLLIREYIEDIREMSALYMDIVSAEVSEYDEEANEMINSILKEMDMIGSTQERALFLGLFRRIDSSTNIIRMLRLIESFVARSRLTDIVTGKDITELYAQICSDITDYSDKVSFLSERLSSEAPDEEIFVSSISNGEFKLSKQTTYVLRKYEKEYYRSGKDDKLLKQGEIEHIVPRGAFSTKKYSTWPEYLSASEEEFERAVDKLGNLLLLEKRLNIKAKDDPFEQKKRKYEDSEFSMSKKMTRNSRWSIELIEERTERLAKAAPEIWNFSH